jgi:hypothetical protein
LSRAEAGLRRIVSDLSALGRRFALVGGLTVSVRTEPRLTRDSDLAVFVADDRDAEALVRDLCHLIALKVRARDDRTRPQDRVDLAALLSRADAATLAEAREALTLIARRGFHRGRDLLAGLDAAVIEFQS